MNGATVLGLADGPPISELEMMVSQLLVDVREGRVISAAVLMVTPTGDVGSAASGPALVPLIAASVILTDQLVQLTKQPVKRSSLVRATGLPS